MLLNINVFLWDEDVDVREDGVLDEDVVEVFTSGHCHAFALALHKAFGWEVVGALWEEHSASTPGILDPENWTEGCCPDFKGRSSVRLPGHVLCRDERGRLFDVRGELDAGDECHDDAEPIDPEWARGAFDGFYRPCEDAFAAIFIDAWRKEHL